MLESAPNSGRPLEGYIKPDTSFSMEEYNGRNNESHENDSFREQTISKMSAKQKDTALTKAIY